MMIHFCEKCQDTGFRQCPVLLIQQFCVDERCPFAQIVRVLEDQNRILEKYLYGA